MQHFLQLNTKNRRNRRFDFVFFRQFSLIWYRGTRDELFNADALENYFLVISYATSANLERSAS